jgi:uncharacterized membrane protein YhhN
MKPRSLSILSLVFWTLCVADLLAIYAGIENLQLLIKPLLLPTLMIMMAGMPKTYPGKKLLLIGLFFSWMGDVWLMLPDHDGLFFMLGLVSFLITHIFYIIFFLRIRSDEPSLLRQQPWWVLLVIGYGITLAWLLFPNLGPLKIPVIIYATVLCSMLLSSLYVYRKVIPSAARLYWLGAAFFVISDSLLAINKFYQSLPAAGILIMLTYCAAQYGIVMGFIKQAGHTVNPTADQLAD